MSNKSISFKKAVLLNASSKYITVVLQLVYTAILSRILTPAEYGTVAIINVFIVFFHLFTDMGLGTGVIQNKNLTNNEINDIFSYTIYMGFGLLILFSFFSIPLSAIYQNKIYIPLGIELAFSLMFNAFNMIPNAVLLKGKKFFSIAIRTIFVSIVSFTSTICFAIKGFGVYALAANSVITAFGMFIWNECSTKLRFKIKPSSASIKKIWGYSMFQFGSQTLNYFNRNLDNLLIGRFFSAADLGQYNKAYTLMQYPISYLPGVITPVLHPILSERQSDKEYIYTTYIKLVKILSLVGCFCAAFCHFAGREIILIAFGSQWMDAIFPFKILGLSIWAQILTHTIAPIYQSLGNTKLMFRSTIITTLLLVSSILLGFLGGSINTISITISVGYTLNFFVTFIIMIKYCFSYRFMDFMKNFVPEVIIFAMLFLVDVFWPLKFETIFLSFIVKLAVYLLVYGFLLLITKQHKVFLYLIKK